MACGSRLWKWIWKVIFVTDTFAHFFKLTENPNIEHLLTMNSQLTYKQYIRVYVFVLRPVLTSLESRSKRPGNQFNEFPSRRGWAWASDSGYQEPSWCYRLDALPTVQPHHGVPTLNQQPSAETPGIPVA